jgi:drug/metabolite transporter (DMT)-like permease
VAAVCFGVGQLLNRKSNQLIDAYRTTFGLLVVVETLLIGRALLAGELGMLATAPLASLAAFVVAALIHFGGAWTLLGLSQQRIGVARTGALVAAAPLVGTLLAAAFLDEPLTWATAGGVSLAAAGVALISMSGRSDDGDWARPWFALGVALLWGTSPLLIRLGLRGFDQPLLGLTAGLAVSVLVYGVVLSMSGAWRRPLPGAALGWISLGGAVSTLAISAQWLSFGLTTIAISITIQQLSTLVVVALVPLLFHEPFERFNPRFLIGTAAMLGGAAIVVAAGA